MLQPDHSTVLLAVAAILMGWCYFFLQRRKTGDHRRLPPCPVRPWPLVGNMFSLGEDIRAQFKAWHKQCGDIYCLYFGNTLLVVVNGFTTIKKVFVQNGAVSSDRPRVFFNEVAGMGQAGLGFATGATWKDNRSTSLQILREFGMGSTSNFLADTVRKETVCLVNKLVEKEGKTVDLLYFARVSMANVILSMLIGRRFSYEDPRFKNAVERMINVAESARGAGAINFLPFLKYLPGDMFDAKKIQVNLKPFADFLVEEIIELESNGCSKSDTVERSADNFISSYKRRQTEKLQSGKKTSLNYENMIKSALDLFAAGTETTSSTIIWCVLFILHSTDVQSKIHEELDREVGQGRQPTMEDQKNLPYLGAVIKETQRLASVLPFSVLHKTSKEIAIGDFVIPEGTTLMPSLDSVLHDPQIWGDDAEEFNPERFLDKDGNLIHREEFIPFFVGPRYCVGEAMAKMELFLFLSSMFQRFNFVAIDPENPPTLKPIIGVVSVPTPYKVLCVDRFK
ncbi:hypothetical protein EGW08_003189 [Elysia chlorotica]|uniref:Cytochrome P450 n=1 Tax=Elysia chlorotica TaxID=188477 RepID=A0A3S1BUJ4_ELYCH|nr:hypothetical protein EGW08_003189 [Elysia chlorotica]